MIGLIQRVTHAAVAVEGVAVGSIGRGVLALVAVERGDGEAQAKRLAERILQYRIFPDEAGRMNRSLLDIDGELLLVSQFTLAADTHKGSKPSFTPAAEPGEGRRWFECLVAQARVMHPKISTGQFGADMQVSLVNDGPVTFSLRVSPHQA